MFLKSPIRFFGRGIIPDYEVKQTCEDFMKNRDIQLEYTMKLIEKK